MTLSNEDLQSICDMATQGEWHSGGAPCANTEECLDICRANLELTKEPIPYFMEVYLDDGRRTALVGNGPNGIANANFIATFNPVMVKAMLQQVAMATQHSEALQRIGSALGLDAGSDLHTDCVAAITAMNTRANTPDSAAQGAMEEGKIISDFLDRYSKAKLAVLALDPKEGAMHYNYQKAMDVVSHMRDFLVHDQYAATHLECSDKDKQ